MTKYKVDKELKKYLRGFLIRSYHQHRFTTDEDGQLWCEINVTENIFDRIIDRVRCEKISIDEKSSEFYVTAKEAMNVGFITSSLAFLGRTSYVVVDFSKYMEMMYGDDPELYKKYDVNTNNTTS